MTAGPYRMDGLNIVGADGCVVATMNKPGGDLSSTAYAGGRLFVAAPELLAACKIALAQVIQDNDERQAEYRGTETQLRAAIAKAEGRS